MLREIIQLVLHDKEVHPKTSSDAVIVNEQERTLQEELEKISELLKSLNSFVAQVSNRSGDTLVSLTQKFKNLLSDNAYLGSDFLLESFNRSSPEESYQSFNDWLDSVSFAGSAANYWGRCRAKVFNANIECYNFVNSIDVAIQSGTQLVFGPVQISDNKVAGSREFHFCYRSGNSGSWNSWKQIGSTSDLLERVNNLVDDLKKTNESLKLVKETFLYAQDTAFVEPGDMRAVMQNGKIVSILTKTSAIYDVTSKKPLINTLIEFQAKLNKLERDLQNGSLNPENITDEFRKALYENAYRDIAKFCEVTSLSDVNDTLKHDTQDYNGLIRVKVTSLNINLFCFSYVLPGINTYQLLIGPINVDPSRSLTLDTKTRFLFRAGKESNWNDFELLFDLDSTNSELTNLINNIKALSIESTSSEDSISLAFKANKLFATVLELTSASAGRAGLMSSQSFQDLTDLKSRMGSAEQAIEKINKVKDNHVFLTKEQYESIVTPDQDKIYMIYE